MLDCPQALDTNPNSFSSSYQTHSNGHHALKPHLSSYHLKNNPKTILSKSKDQKPIHLPKLSNRPTNMPLILHVTCFKPYLASQMLKPPTHPSNLSFSKPFLLPQGQSMSQTTLKPKTDGDSHKTPLKMQPYCQVRQKMDL